jgi:hypothetical protein
MDSTSYNVVGFFGNEDDRERIVDIAQSVFFASRVDSHHVINKYGTLVAVASIEGSGASLIALLEELSRRMSGVMFDLRLDVLPGTEIATRRLVIMDGLVVDDVEPLDPLSYVNDSVEVPSKDGRLMFFNPQRNLELVLHDDYSVNYVGTVIATMDLFYSFLHEDIEFGLHWKEKWDMRSVAEMIAALESLLTAEESSRIAQHRERHRQKVEALTACQKVSDGLRGAG